MNKKQYNNIISHSLQYDCKDVENPLDTAKIIFNNMGVALPQGTIKEVYDTVSTNEYMGWKKCTIEEAKEIGKQRAREILNEQIENQDNILNEQVVTYEDAGYVEVEVTYEVQENMGTKEKIVF